MSAIPIDAEGRFAGYASVFSRLDSGGDIVLPGAFAKSLVRRRGRIRLLFQHDPKEPVGTWESMGEDSHGLFVTGRLVPGVPRSDALKRLIGNGALDGLSIGFRTVKASRRDGNRLLHEIDLYEVSIVTFPMMEEARIASPLTAGAAIAAATKTIRNR
ncbi:HK97 family phage prohead protease [Devosia salina]|uniref:HK97 family phage prohead protease n=1 Tax=Devosia salina TaxID=2860336 RepID=A0ABX8WHW3_9HYPH|nr:HK97 family phage prohead protease [Devosia salina]QYO77943.1 HK97 family phage prohead protease [Devosia salina]